MKATDLMIGDWVYGKKAPELPFIVTGVARNIFVADGKFINGKCGDGTSAGPFVEEEIKPIPLTQQILEKNGIKLLEVGDNGVATPARYRNRFEKWEIHTQWKDTYLWYDRQAKHWHLHDMGAAKLYYVHELQHALKLCGIEKEITL